MAILMPNKVEFNAKLINYICMFYVLWMKGTIFKENIKTCAPLHKNNQHQNM